MIGTERESSILPLPLSHRHVHSRTHTHIHTHTHTYKQTHIHTQVHTRIHILIHTQLPRFSVYRIGMLLVCGLLDVIR